MLEPIILDNVENIRRWRNGMETFCAPAAAWLTTTAAGDATFGHTVGGAWIDSDTLILGIKRTNIETHKLILSTKTLSSISASLGPISPAMMQPDASGIIWMVEASSGDLYKYNTGTSSWTLVSALTGDCAFGYDAAGCLHLNNAGAYYSLIAGGMNSESAPSGVIWNGGSGGRTTQAPNKYNRYLDDPAPATNSSVYPYDMKDSAAAIKQTVLLESNGTSRPQRPFMIPIQGSSTVVLAGHMCCYVGNFLMSACLYDVSSDTYTRLPVVSFYGRQASTVTNVPQAAQIAGDRLCVWMVTPNEHTSTAGTFYLPVIRAEIPL